MLDLPPLVPGSPYDSAAHNAAIARHSVPAPSPAETPALPAPPGPDPPPASEPGLPSFARQVGGFLRSAASVVAGAVSDVASGRMPAPLLDDADYEARLAICGACDHYRPSDRRCGLASGCGCYLADRVSVPGKARYRDAACPIGKW